MTAAQILAVALTMEVSAASRFGVNPRIGFQPQRPSTELHSVPIMKLCSEFHVSGAVDVAN